MTHSLSLYHYHSHWLTSSVAFTFTPSSTKYRVTDVCPNLAALWSAIRPPWIDNEGDERRENERSVKVIRSGRESRRAVDCTRIWFQFDLLHKRKADSLDPKKHLVVSLYIIIIVTIESVRLARQRLPRSDRTSLVLLNLWGSEDTEIDRVQKMENEELGMEGLERWK